MLGLLTTSFFCYALSKERLDFKDLVVDYLTVNRHTQVNDLGITGDVMIASANHFRSDATNHFNGDVYVDDIQGFTGSCEWTPVFVKGIMVDCVGPS